MSLEVLDISGDVGLKANGATFEEALGNLGVGLYSLITDLESIDRRLTRDVEVEADSREALTVRYLNELVFLFDAYGLVGREIDILSFSGVPGNAAISFRIRGEEFDPDRHARGILVKAATYHNLVCAQGEGGWLIEVMLDI